MLKLVRPIIVAACIAGLAAPASADEVTVKVGYQDLDLADPDDVGILRDRLEGALRRACDEHPSRKPVPTQVSEACVASGLANGEKVISAHRDRALAATP
jgi:UrcA family protein